MELNERKSHDYASDDETLKNFKQVSALLNALDISLPFTPAKINLIYILLKIQRLTNLINEERANLRHSNGYEFIYRLAICEPNGRKGDK